MSKTAILILTLANRNEIIGSKTQSRYMTGRLKIGKLMGISVIHGSDGSASASLKESTLNAVWDSATLATGNRIPNQQNAH